MIRILSIVFALLAGLHGLIHLMGFAAYWPLAVIKDLPYKTTLLGGRLDLGAGGMRIFSLLWLLAGIGFLAAAVALLLGKSSWAPLMLASALLSLLLCVLDWGVAYRGAIVDLIILLVLLVVFGFRQQPAPLPPFTATSAPVQTIPLPAGLPAPVERYYRLIHGDGIPVYTSAVLSGRGALRFMGITIPARVRFTHDSGSGYRHYMETTFYGLPLLMVNESYLDGRTRLELPFGVVEDEPGVDSAANQGLWAETFVYPAYLLTDPRLRWEAVDDDTAKLFVPFKDGEQEFQLEFDPQTGMITRFETLRYRDEKLGVIRWWGDFIYLTDQNGDPVLDSFTATWEDEGTPWLRIAFEDMVFNADVSEYIRQKGP
jgi:hypothetical protein